VGLFRLVNGCVKIGMDIIVFGLGAERASPLHGSCGLT